MGLALIHTMPGVHFTVHQSGYDDQGEVFELLVTDERGGWLRTRDTGLPEHDVRRLLQSRCTDAQVQALLDRARELFTRLSLA